MKFLCVPCDTPMKLETVGPPERGSLSLVYACPACGYEIAMLTNAYETQIVQSLGVRIGPDIGTGAGMRAGSGASVGAGASLGAGASVSSTSSAGCPFTAMIPTSAPASAAISTSDGPPADAVRSALIGDAIAVRWTAAAEARLEKIPAFVRPMARTGIERFARERGAQEVDEQILDAARDFFGM